MNEEISISKEKLEQIVKDQIEKARKDDIVEIYENLLGTIWNRVRDTLGAFTLSTIFRRCIKISAESYSFLSNIQIGEKIDISNLVSKIDVISIEELKEAFSLLVTTFISILVNLTGDIMIKEIVKEFESEEQENGTS